MYKVGKLFSHFFLSGVDVITKKQRAEIIANQKKLTVDIVNIISKAKYPAEKKMKLVSFLLMITDVLDLEQERLDYERLMELSEDANT